MVQHYTNQRGVMFSFRMKTGTGGAIGHTGRSFGNFHGLGDGSEFFASMVD